MAGSGSGPLLPRMEWHLDSLTVDMENTNGEGEVELTRVF